MKRVIGVAILLTVGVVQFASPEDVANSLAIGVQLSQHHDEFGGGLNVTSPYVAADRLAVRSRAGFMFHNYVDLETGNSTWTPYPYVSAGIVAVAGFAGDRIRLSGEGGVSILFPAGEFSSTSLDLAGYGLLGFEFFMDRRGNFFLEVGGIVGDIVADELPSEPIYSTGLLTNVGYRFHL